VVVVVGGTVVVVVGGRVVVVAAVDDVGRVDVVVAPRTVVVVPPAAAVVLGAAADVAASVAEETRKVTSTGLETTSRLAWLAGMTSGASPRSTKAAMVASTSLPNSARSLVQMAVTWNEPSSWVAGLTIWKRLARLADGPPRAVGVVLRPTTRPGNAGLRPGLVEDPGRAPPKRNWAGSTLGSRAENRRTTTSPRPPLPCTDPFSGDSSSARTAVSGMVELVVVSKRGSEVVDDDGSSSEVHEARRTAASTARTVRRNMLRTILPGLATVPLGTLPAMAANKRDRQKALRQARLAREAAEAKARARRRQLVRFAVGVVLVGAVVAFLTTRGDDSTDVATTDTSTTLPGEIGVSAAGKPCVAVADPLPTGAPAVPVKVGPPPTQLLTEDLKPGTGATVAARDTVTVNYIGVSCSTGKIFDSSYERNQPATFGLTGVIKGWTDGIPGMKVGGQRLLGIPPEQGYGPAGSPPDIGANETLWFVVEVLDTKPA
jgi:hypothetical protein